MMTRREALAEARRRWGPTSRVSSFIPRKPSKPRYSVYGPPASEGVPIYEGHSSEGWEGAFRDAVFREPTAAYDRPPSGSIIHRRANGGSLCGKSGYIDTGLEPNCAECEAEYDYQNDPGRIE